MKADTDHPPRNPLDDARFGAAINLVVFAGLPTAILVFPLSLLTPRWMFLPLLLIVWGPVGYFAVRSFLRMRNLMRRRWMTAVMRAGLMSMGVAMLTGFLTIPIGFVLPATQANPDVYFALTVSALVATFSLQLRRMLRAGWLDPHAVWDERFV